MTMSDLCEREREKSDSEMAETYKGTVCVTGGTGFIGSWLIMKLLRHGYTVRTTIRPDSGMYIYDHILSLIKCLYQSHLM